MFIYRYGTDRGKNVIVGDYSNKDGNSNEKVSRYAAIGKFALAD